jgi:hypothetical protein
MPEIAVGTLSLFLGWLCLDHVSRVRARYSTDHSPRSRFYGEKPLMIVQSALGLLFVLDGLALLALAASARLRLTDGLENLMNLEMLLILAPVAAAATALYRTAARERARRRRSRREKSRGRPAVCAPP